MSNRQLGWDEKRVKDRIAPRELAEQDKQLYGQQQAELNSQPLDQNDAEFDGTSLDKDRIEEELNRHLNDERTVESGASGEDNASRK